MGLKIGTFSIKAFPGPAHLVVRIIFRPDPVYRLVIVWPRLSPSVSNTSVLLIS